MAYASIALWQTESRKYDSGNVFSSQDSLTTKFILAIDSWKLWRPNRIMFIYTTACPKSIDTICIASYFKKGVKASWTYSKMYVISQTFLTPFWKNWGIFEVTWCPIFLPSISPVYCVSQKLPQICTAFA